MRKAIRKLVEESAALDQSLVISENGEVKRVPAKDLLASPHHLNLFFPNAILSLKSKKL
jgi:hypothetical protein